MDSGRYSEALASTRILKHSPESSRGQCGENLAWASYDQTGTSLSRLPSPSSPLAELGPGHPMFRPQHPAPCSLGATGPERERGPRALCVCSRGLPAALRSLRWPARGWACAGCQGHRDESDCPALPLGRAPSWGVGAGEKVFSLPFLCSFSLTLWAPKYPQLQFCFLPILLSFLKCWCIHFYHQKNAIELLPC